MMVPGCHVDEGDYGDDGCFESKFDASCENQINCVRHLYHCFVNGGVF